MESVSQELIRDLVCSQNKTHAEVSSILNNLYPGKRGLSERSVRRYCKEKAISSRIKDVDVLDMVTNAVNEVGPTYGRKMMKGYLHQQHNVNVSQRRVAKALRDVAPHYHFKRQTDTARQVNPIPYKADYFGHKLHVDQNEKLVMYGTTHVVAIDGHSRYVCAGTTMAIKNNKIIYDKIFRTLVLKYGLFDQLRVDHGKEFYLMLGIQENLEHLRQNQSMACYRQTQSKKNLPIERFWVEVNSRVNYPIKTVLVEMDNNQRFNMDNGVDRFCVSWFTCQVASFGLQMCIASWNCHPIPGRGVPNHLKDMTSATSRLPSSALPEPDQAVEIYERMYHGRLTDETPFGEDPLCRIPHLMNRRNEIFFTNFSIREIFSDTVNNRYASFENALMFYISETKRLAETV